MPAIRTRSTTPKRCAFRSTRRWPPLCAPSPRLPRISPRRATPMPRPTRCGQEVEFYGDTRAAIKKHSGEELDIKPYEADMRHLLNTYVQADPADRPGQPGPVFPDRADHRDRHPRRHREEAQREGQALEERHRRGHHQQRPQDHHPRSAHRSEVLRGDVEAAGRPHQAEPCRCRGLRGVSAEGRGAGQAAGEEATRRGRTRQSCTASRRPSCSSTISTASRGRQLPVPGADPEEQGQARPGDRPRHAREGAGGLERGLEPARRRCSMRCFRCCRGIAQATLAIFEIIKNQPGY